MALVILEHFGIKRRSANDGPLFEYEEAIAKGLFVPYIGPDCYGLRDEWEPHLKTLGARLDIIRERLEEVNPENQEANREYLKAVVRSHTPDLGDQTDLHGGAVSEEEAAGDLFELRVAVALAGAAASRLLGKSLNRCKGIIDAKAYRVVITEADDPDIKSLRTALQSAKAFAASCGKTNSFCSYHDHSKGCMGPRHIEAKLELFLNAVFKGKETDVNMHEVHLSLSQLDWLSDLLWHLMRFDLPIFPKPDEIDFCLALCQTTKHFVRIPFGTTAAIQTAECNGKESQIKDLNLTIAQCTQHMHRKLYRKMSSGPTQFYRAMAKLLWNSYLLCAETLRVDDDGPAYEESAGDRPAYEESVSAAQKPYPIVVSMNIDEELEKCLQHVTYSVLYPVQAVNDTKTYWFLRVHKENSDRYYLFPLSNTVESEIYKALSGPLIVKYRGSPFHNSRANDIYDIGAPDTPTALKSSAENRLLLSSLDFVQELSDSDLGEPRWLKQQLDNVDRVKCFLGYPLDDMDGILGIHRNVWVGEGDGNKERLSIGCRHRDGLDSELLTGLRVKPLAMDLNDFAAEVDKFQEFVDLPKGKKYA